MEPSQSWRPLLENSKAPPDNENVILGGAINKARAVGNSLDGLEVETLPDRSTSLEKGRDGRS